MALKRFIRNIIIFLVRIKNNALAQHTHFYLSKCFLAFAAVIMNNFEITFLFTQIM